MTARELGKGGLPDGTEADLDLETLGNFLPFEGLELAEVAGEELGEDVSELAVDGGQVSTRTSRKQEERRRTDVLTISQVFFSVSVLCSSSTATVSSILVLSLTTCLYMPMRSFSFFSTLRRKSESQHKCECEGGQGRRRGGRTCQSSRGLSG